MPDFTSSLSMSARATPAAHSALAKTAHHALVLFALADEGVMKLIGSACSEADFSPGAPACVELTLAPPLDMAVKAGCDGACPCTQAPDSCPAKEYCTDAKMCAAGCK